MKIVCAIEIYLKIRPKYFLSVFDKYIAYLKFYVI